VIYFTSTGGYKTNIGNWVWWYILVFPATQDVEAGELQLETSEEKIRKTFSQKQAKIV
jgi:hypothetical protein